MVAVGFTLSEWLNHFFILQQETGSFAIGQYNYLLVLLSLALASMASFFALHFASIAKYIVVEKYRKIALISGAFIMAGGIWSMHFVGMLAFDMGHSVSYDPVLTLISVIPCIFAAYVTLNKLIEPDLTLWQLLQSGVIVGGGIGTMHYIGMEAMEMHVDLKYDPWLFTTSIAVAVVLAFIALSTHYKIGKLFPTLSEKQVSAVSAFIMGLAISGMHYTGMAGAKFIPHGDMDMSAMSDNANSYLSLVVAIITLLLSILAANIASQLRYRQLLMEKTASEVRLKTTLDTAVDGIITIDSQGIIREFNRAAEKIFGWDEADILAHSIKQLFPKKYANEFEQALNSFRLHGTTVLTGSDREIEATHKNGTIFPVRLGIGRVEIPGQETLFVGFISDISARKQMEEAVKKSEKQYSSLIKNIPGATFRCLFDDDWSVIFVSEAIVELTGWNAQDFYDKKVTLAALLHPEDTNMIDQNLQIAIQQHRSYNIEYRLRHKKGHYIWVMENGTIIFNDDDKPEWIDGVLLDISDRVHMEDDLRLAKEKAEASAETKALFLANMSHEIRTPMNAIIGFSDILLESDVTPDNKKHLATISKSARSLLHLLNDILDSAKLEKNKLDLDIQVFELSAMVDTVISTLWLQAKSKGLDLNFQIAPDLAKAYRGAEDRIRQVLMNILGNAIKFTEQGSVTLTVTKQKDNQIRFQIEDTGIGIETSRLEHIFDPFTQADASMSRRFGGTGLGTSISKQLVQLMGGDIHVTSEIGIGSCFYFDLPLEASTALPESKASHLPHITPKTILLADDIEQNLTLLTLILKRQGHVIEVAQDGHQAFTKYQSVAPDLVLMDIQMPNMDGLSATQAIRQFEQQNQRPRTPIIALTANVLMEDKVEAQQAGMDGFANKPIDVHALTMEMARVLSLDTSELEAANAVVDEQKTKQININKGLSLWMELPLYLSELNKFSEQHKQLIEQLNALLEQKQYQTIMALAHSIKGTSGNLALLCLSNNMAALEKEAKQQNAPAIQQLIDELINHFFDFNQELQSLQNEHQDELEEHTDQQDKNASDEPLLPLIEDLIEGVNLGEIDDDGLEKLLNQVPKSMKTHALEANKAVANFDFHSAMESLTAIKEMMSELEI